MSLSWLAGWKQPTLEGATSILRALPPQMCLSADWPEWVAWHAVPGWTVSCFGGRAPGQGNSLLAVATAAAQEHTGAQHTNTAAPRPASVPRTHVATRLRSIAIANAHDCNERVSVRSLLPPHPQQHRLAAAASQSPRIAPTRPRRQQPPPTAPPSAHPLPILRATGLTSFHLRRRDLAARPRSIHHSIAAALDVRPCATRDQLLHDTASPHEHSYQLRASTPSQWVRDPPI